MQATVRTSSESRAFWIGFTSSLIRYVILVHRPMSDSALPTTPCLGNVVGRFIRY